MASAGGWRGVGARRIRMDPHVMSREYQSERGKRDPSAKNGLDTTDVEWNAEGVER
jgi:hypothetical protein